METYEEVLRRNEPKNYTVRWSIAGKPEAAFSFSNFDEADLFADVVRKKDYVENVRVLRAGRHPSAKKWAPTHRPTKSVHAKREYGVTVNEDAWKLPAGFVDGDADKHGPVVYGPLPAKPSRTNAEKAKWARNNKFEDKTCLWQ